MIAYHTLAGVVLVELEPHELADLVGWLERGDAGEGAAQWRRALDAMFPDGVDRPEPVPAEPEAQLPLLP